MKPSTVPTAPALRAHSQPHRIGWLVLTVLLSLGAGSSAALFTLSIPAQWPNLERWLKLSSSDLLVIPPTDDTGTATIVSAIQDRQFDAVVDISVAGEPRGVALIVSNDGWLVTPHHTVAGSETVTVTLASGNQIESDQLVVDDYAGVSFIHIPKKNLPIVDLRTQAAALGDAALVLQPAVSRQPTVHVTHLASVFYPLTSEFNTNHNPLGYRSDRILPGVVSGAPVFDYHAQVLGMMLDDQVMIPLVAFNGRLQQLLAYDRLLPIPLAVTYELSDQGATLVSSTTPELLVGDVITSVNGQSINFANDLSWLVQDTTQSTIQLKLLRAGTKQSINLERL